MDFEALLDALQSPDRVIRSSAEETLNSAETTDSFAREALLRIRDPEYPLGKRQLVLTIIKQLVRSRWHELHATVTSDIVCGLLPFVSDSSASVQSLCHASLALASSRMDAGQFASMFDLIESALASARNSPDSVSALLDLLGEMIDECGGLRFDPMMGRLNGVLLRACEGSLTRKSFGVFSRLLVALAQDEEHAVIESIGTDAWTPVFVQLSQSSELRDRIVVLDFFRDMMKNDLVSLVRPSVSGLIEQSIYCLDQWKDRATSEEEEEDIQNLVMSICDFFNALVLVPGVCSADQIRRFIACMGQYVPLSRSQEEEYLDDPNEFIASEQEDSPNVTVRVAFEGIIADMLYDPSLSQIAVDALISASRGMLEEGAVTRSRNEPEWWRMAECGFFLLSLVQGQQFPQEAVVDLVQMAASMCLNPNVSVFLQARAFLTLSKMWEVVLKNFKSDLVTILRRAVDGIKSDSVLVAFAACSAFNVFVANVPLTDEVEELLFGENGGTVSLMKLAATSESREVVSFSLEALVGVARACTGLGARVDTRFPRFVAGMLEKHVSDPIAPIQVLELIAESNLEAPLADEVVIHVATVIRPWLVADAENRLDVALETLQTLVRITPIPCNINLNKCIHVLKDGSLSEIGPETNNVIQQIIHDWEARLN